MLQIWLGGAPNQTRLAETFMDRVKLDKLESVLEPLFYMWKTERHEKEGFGDFIYRQVLIYLLCFDWDQKGGRMSFNFGPHALFRIWAIFTSTEGVVAICLGFSYLEIFHYTGL
jgi:hypothetical protein